MENIQNTDSNINNNSNSTDPKPTKENKKVVSPLKGVFDNYKEKDKNTTFNTDPEKDEKKEAKVSPLASVFKATKENNKTANPRKEFSDTINFDTKQYEGYVKAINPNANLDRERALNQTTEEKVGRTLKNLLPNIGIGLIESVGNIGAVVGNAAGTNDSFSNDITRWAEKAKNPFGDVYQKDASETFAVDDAAWWLNHGSGLVTSIAQFAMVGAGAARAFGTVAKGISRLGAAQKATQAGAQVMTAGTMAAVEGAMTATDVWRRSIQKGIDSNKDMEETRQEAAKAAAITFGASTAMVTALNMTSMGAFFKPVGKSATATAMNVRQKVGESMADFQKRLVQRAKYDPSLRRTLKGYGLEATQEGFEEQVNLIAEKEGERYYDDVSGRYLSLDQQQDGFDRAIGAMLSDEGLLNFMLGAAGGIGQTAITSNVPIHKRYSEDGKVKYLSSRQIEVLEKTDTINKFGKEIITDLQKVHDLSKRLKEVQNTKIDATDPDKAEVLEWNKQQEIEKVKQELFNVRASRSIRSGVTEPILGELSKIAQLSNTNPYVDQELEQEIKANEKSLEEVFNKLQGLANNQPTSGQAESSEPDAALSDQVRALADQKTQLENDLKEQYKIKEENALKTEAEYFGFSEGENDVDYKKKALRAINDIKELSSKWEEIQKRYSSDKEVQANLPNYVFGLEQQKVFNRNNKDDIDRELAKTKSSLREKRESELNNDSYIDYETYEEARLTVLAKQQLLDSNQEILEAVTRIKSNKGTTEDFAKINKAYEDNNITPENNNEDILETLAQTLESQSEQAYTKIDELESNIKDVKERYKESTGKEIEKELSRQLSEEKYLEQLISIKETLEERQANIAKNLSEISSSEGRKKFIIGAAKARERNLKILKEQKKANRLDNRIKAFAKAKKLQFDEVKKKVQEKGEEFLNDINVIKEGALANPNFKIIVDRAKSLVSDAKFIEQAIRENPNAKQALTQLKDVVSDAQFIAKAVKDDPNTIKAIEQAKNLLSDAKFIAKAAKENPNVIKVLEEVKSILDEVKNIKTTAKVIKEGANQNDNFKKALAKAETLKDKAKIIALNLLSNGKQLTKEVKDYLTDKELNDIAKDAKELASSLSQKAEDAANVALKTKKGNEIKKERSVKEKADEKLNNNEGINYRGASRSNPNTTYNVNIKLNEDGTKVYSVSEVDDATKETNVAMINRTTKLSDDQIFSQFFVKDSYDVYDPLDDVEDSVFEVEEKRQEEEDAEEYDSIQEALIAAGAKGVTMAKKETNKAVKVISDVMLSDDAKKIATSLFNTLQKVRKKGGSIINEKLKSNALSDDSKGAWESYIEGVKQSTDRDQLRDNLDENAKEVFEDINSIYRDLDYLIGTLNPNSLEDFLITLGTANNGFMKQKVIDNLNEFISLYLANPRTEETIMSINPKQVVSNVLSTLVGDTYVPRPAKSKVVPERSTRAIIRQSLDSLFSTDSKASLLGLSQNGLFEDGGFKKLSASTIANQTVPFRYIEVLNKKTGRYEISRRLTSNPETAKEVQTERITKETPLEFIVDEDYNGFIYDEEGTKLTVGALKKRYNVPENENLWKYLKANNKEYYISKVPIKVVARGETIGYVHDFDWINRDDEINNIAREIYIDGQVIDNKAIQEANIMNIRNKIIGNAEKGKVTKGEVGSKSIGFLNIDAEEKYSPIKQNIKKLDNLEFSIVKEGDFQTSIDTVSKKTTPFDMPVEEDEGRLYVFYPSSDNKDYGVREEVELPKLSSVKNKNGSLVDTTVLLMAEMYKNKNYKEVKKIIGDYLFLGDATQNSLNGLSSGVRINITNNGLIFFGEAGGQLQVVKDAKGFEENIDNIAGILNRMYVAANLDNLSSDSDIMINFPYLSKNLDIQYKAMEYKQFLSSVGTVMTKGIKDGNNEVYFNNPVITYIFEGEVNNKDTDNKNKSKKSTDNKKDDFDPMEGLMDSLMSNALSENEYNNIESNLNNNC